MTFLENNKRTSTPHRSGLNKDNKEGEFDINKYLKPLCGWKRVVVVSKVTTKKV